MGATLEGGALGATLEGGAFGTLPFGNAARDGDAGGALWAVSCIFFFFSRVLMGIRYCKCSK